MKYVYNDGGRKASGYKGNAGDCVARSIAIVTGLPYQQVYESLASGAQGERKTKHGGSSGKKSARNGIHVKRQWFKEYMAALGFKWTPTMLIGSGCKVHLSDGELPAGGLVVSVSKHYTAVINGTIHDTHNPSERGTTIYPPNTLPEQMPKNVRWLENGNGWAYEPKRCVYGYWSK